jgi:hypothetical protein
MSALTTARQPAAAEVSSCCSVAYQVPHHSGTYQLCDLHASHRLQLATLWLHKSCPAVSAHSAPQSGGCAKSIPDMCAGTTAARPRAAATRRACCTTTSPPTPPMPAATQPAHAACPALAPVTRRRRRLDAALQGPQCRGQCARQQTGSLCAAPAAARAAVSKFSALVAQAVPERRWKGNCGASAAHRAPAGRRAAAARRFAYMASHAR